MKVVLVEKTDRIYRNTSNEAHPLQARGARILANPIYSGPFIGKGKTYEGTHMPLVTRDLFERANVAMGLKSRPKKNKHDLAFIIGQVRPLRRVPHRRSK